MTRRLVLLLAASLLVAGCGNGEPTTRSAAVDVAGRGLQQAWWQALPEPTPKEEPATLELPADALFATGSAEVRPADLPQLEAFAAELEKVLTSTTGTWTVVGATDTTGDGNEALGLARAQAVAEVLEGAAPAARGRLRTASWGETCLAVEEASAPDLAQARAQNRRVVIVPPSAVPPCPVP